MLAVVQRRKRQRHLMPRFGHLPARRLIDGRHHYERVEAPVVVQAVVLRAAYRHKHDVVLTLFLDHLRAQCVLYVAPRLTKPTFRVYAVVIQYLLDFLFRSVPDTLP